MTPLEAANYWLTRAFSPVPVPYRTKKAVLVGWQKLQITTELAPQYFNGARQNIGVHLGDKYGSTDVDCDCAESISAARLLLPETGMIFGRDSKSFSHYFYRSDPPVQTRQFRDPVDDIMLVELRGLSADGNIGLQTVVPPSIHESGETIRFENGFDREPANIDAPVLQTAVRKVAASALLVRHWPRAGKGRHVTMLCLAGVLERAGWKVDDAVSFCLALYQTIPDHDRRAIARTESEVRDTYKNAEAGRAVTGIPTLQERFDKRIVEKVLEWLRVGRLTPEPGARFAQGEHSHLSIEAGQSEAAVDLLPYGEHDHGNACRLKALFGNDLRYCHAMKKWLVWDGRRWAVDDTEQARGFAVRTILEMLRLYEVQFGAGAVANWKFGRMSLDARRIDNLLSMAEFELPVRPAELDTDPFALNFQNGTIDLRTGELRPHRRTDLITKLVHFDYVPGAQSPRWKLFLEQIMGGGPEASEGALDRADRLIAYLQRALGYSLTGITSEKAVFVPFGTGNNGKTTLLSTIQQTFPEYSALLQIDSLMTRQETNNTQADLADLRGARFVQTSEAEEGQRFAQGKLKRITQGMGKIKATRKYENPIEFPETHKLWLDTNRKPEITDADDKATFNRLHPIPFTVTIPDDQIDKELPKKLLEEREGIAAWGVHAARLWYESGLQKPAEIEEAKAQWHAENDQIGRFIEERCVLKVGLEAPGGALYKAYKQWVEESGEKKVLSSNAFGTKLITRFEKKHTDRGARYFGIALLTPDGC